MRNRPLGGVHVASAIRAGASAAEWVVYAPRWVHCGTQTPRRAHNEHPLHSVVARPVRVRLMAISFFFGTFFGRMWQMEHLVSINQIVVELC